MFKRFAAGLILLAVMCGVSWGATEYDPYQLHFWYTSPDLESQVYGRYGNTDYNFFYQLRDITGSSRSEKVAGSQWFATVYENYYYGIRSVYGVATDETYTGIYRRTMGGEMPDITFSVVGDLLDGFNFVFAEEPQPYASAWRRYVNRQVYDTYPDPVESLCFVITNGQGEINIDFGNPYARHFPFWWDFSTTSKTKTTTKWWLQGFDWRNETYPTSEPIAYIYSSPDLYVRNDSNGKYEIGYKLVVSNDYSSDKTTVIATHVQLRDTAGKVMYNVSGDNSIYTSSDVLVYTVNASQDKVYDASGNLVYTIETDSAGDMFICETRSVNESINFSGFDSNYSFTINPSAEQAVSSGGSLKTKVNIRGLASSAYGSTLGYITFRQRASLATGYTNYREFTSLPLVIANVAEGNASEVPLMFDMIVSDSADNVVNRIKFTWDAQSDKPDQDLGTFFMIGSRDVTYKLETRITNRTGTRYELYRYDTTNSVNGNPVDRDGYSSIMPDYWKYDLTEDMYGTLPESFLLDAHSQIAPGLVTVYKNNIASGYRTLDTAQDTSESFRLYEYASANPKNLRLRYKMTVGMTPIEGGNHTPSSGVNVREFVMKFMDVANNTNNTAEELYVLTGKLPAMIGIGPLISDTSRITGASYGDDSDPALVFQTDISSTAVDAFRITKAVPVTTPPLVRLQINGTDTDTSSGDTSSGDKGMRGVSVSEITYTSIDIPLQPISVRMRINRKHSLIVDHWDDMNNAANSTELFNIFSRYCTVKVRSDATGERDANLFSAINNKGNNLGVSAKDCVRAFIDNEELCIDFIVIMADGVSTEEGKTAYVEVFKDDNIPYILIGDGREDGKWDLAFYISSAAETDTGDGIADPNTNTQTNTNNGPSQGVGGGSSGGGGCNVPGMLLGFALAGISLLAKKR